MLCRASERRSKNVAQAITFLATFPQDMPRSNYAIVIGRDGMTIQLEVPESEMAQAIELLAWRDRALKVTIQACTPDDLLHYKHQLSKRG